MADIRRYSVTPQLDIQQILHEAQNRWLRPVEICEILHNYKKFRIAPEPPNRPPSGSLFLFDRKVLRYFRKDNHNWRKKKDGKTVKEAHEKLKDGSIDVLHCYYAHGEENETFQRRTYWLLEVEYTHIVLVHYLEVKGGKQSYTRLKETEARASSPLGSNSNNSVGTSPSRPSSHYPDADSPNSANTSEYEDKISDNCLRPSTSSSSCTSVGIGTGHHSFSEMRHYDAGPLIPPNSLYTYDQCYNGVMNQLTPNSDYYTPSPQDISRVFDDGFGLTINSSNTQSELATWDEVLEQSFSNPEDSYTASFDQTDNNTGADISSILQIEDSGIGCLVRSSNKTIVEDTNNKKTYSSPLMKELSGDLKKHDSFSRWMSKELGGAIEELSAKSCSDSYWSNIAVENDAVVGESGISITNSENLDTGILSPSLSQDQLFSIIDFSPSWAYVGSETKVLMTGTFLKQKEEVDKCNWSCMFGEEEVPAQILSDGTLRCYALVHKVGRVPFYVSCSNRIACSEIREFEFRESSPEKSDMEISDPCSANSINEMHLKIRLEKLLSLDHHSEQTVLKTNVSVGLYNRITALLVDDDEWSGLMRMTDGKDWLVQKLMKERLNSWLIQKVRVEGKGPNVLGQEGQGVIHLVAALGYDWAIKPIVIAGVNVNFRDVHGWTALHWAASCGRERTVVALKTLGADPGTLTDPTPEFPSGRTPADLASMNGHKGIAGFLAESSLTSHLSTLTLKDLNANITTTNTTNQHVGFDVFEDTTSSQNGSMEDSLSAVRNATQAAARIYQVFRLQSFHRKKILESGQEKTEINEEEDALALLTVRSANKSGSHEAPLHSAAVRIQNKFRGWKGRKEFLIIRQRIVKIQAHVRGHQARKRYRIQLTVGIVKVILRWRRKSAALRGAKNLTIAETAAPSSSSQNENENRKEDNYDVLQEGRKQTEARLQRALERVKSMVQYPEARDQYRRLMNGVSEHQENKAEEKIMSESEDVDGDDFMAGLEEFGGDDIMFGLEELAR